MAVVAMLVVTRNESDAACPVRGSTHAEHLPEKIPSSQYYADHRQELRNRSLEDVETPIHR